MSLSPYLDLLRNRVNLRDVPFTERGSRLMLFFRENHFFIRLAERWIKRDRQLAAYRTRPPIIDELQFLDEAGRPLDLEITTYPHQVLCGTRLGEIAITFQDMETFLITLPASLPAGRIGCTFLARIDLATLDRRGGVLGMTGDIRRNIAYTTNMRLVENYAEPVEGGYRIYMTMEPMAEEAIRPVLLLNITPRLGFNRYVVDPDPVFARVAQHWHDWFAAAPAVLPELQRQYYFAWWIMRAGLISPRFYITYEAMTPSKIYYVGVWQWDAYFHALAYRHVDARLAQDQLRMQLDHQTPEGMIPDAIHDEGTVTHLNVPVEADVTKPPLIAWTAWKLHQHAPDIEFLREIYDPLVRWNNWWFERNDLDSNGLCEYLHPFSSGLDDSPLWDAGVPVEAPDLNTYLYLQQEALARIAETIGEAEDAKMWAERADRMLERLIAIDWDAESGLFLARHKGLPLPVRTPFSLFPLLTGRLPEDIAKRLVAHLTDPKEFWPAYPVPSVALDDPRYNPLQMWRGPTWLNVNYLLIEGLLRSGYPDVARELRERTLALVAQQDNIYEYYQPQTGEVPPLAAPIFGWSAAVFIELAIQASQEVLG